jgi:hypothetical protein
MKLKLIRDVVPLRVAPPTSPTAGAGSLLRARARRDGEVACRRSWSLLRARARRPPGWRSGPPLPQVGSAL